MTVERMLDNPENSRRSYQRGDPPDGCPPNPIAERKDTTRLFRNHLWTQYYQHSTDNPIERNHAFRHQTVWTEADQSAFKIEDNHPP